ncbi:MAG: GspH/FimT family pseudopilin [Gammaproteobacteria bacterium]|nr:GspH/FimT family pseudopilin [Gammaproteobacteria bacterium]NNF61686.1 prepilin-type N-terminal cleavage/methylation domain-containing protein [Gammaproteobacteria bacterium]NNM20316.1 prepilin-type N-terminal cleavage/methylation domain-containing protein [Gammaproteobacteria bacterium]
MVRGFTLIELLYTLVIVALVLTIGAPTFQSTVRNSRMTASVNNMIASLQLARSEAIKRRGPVSICTSADITPDDPSCDSTSPWHDGWMAFVDDNGNGSRETDEPILRREAGMKGSVQVTVPADQPLQTSLTYLASGFPNLGALSAAGFLLFCDDRSSDRFGRVISVPQTGRPVVATVDDRPDLGVTCE